MCLEININIPYSIDHHANAVGHITVTSTLVNYLAGIKLLNGRLFSGYWWVYG